MKALRLKLFQETACYKKPHAFKVSETYPIPPFSTVKGMLHSLLEAESLIPMKLCIQGNYDTIINDYQTHYFFKTDKTNEFALTADGLSISRELTDITTMPIYMHMLYHVELVIFVQAEEAVLRQIKTIIESGGTSISLGRWEDLVRVDECEIMELLEPEEDIELPYNAFVPTKFIGYRQTYIPYNLNWTYRIVDGVRVWEKIRAGYVEKGVSLKADHEELYIDPDGLPVFFHD
jgi:CRISPR-associated protein Cas5t